MIQTTEKLLTFSHKVYMCLHGLQDNMKEMLYNRFSVAVHKEYSLVSQLCGQTIKHAGHLSLAL